MSLKSIKISKLTDKEPSETTFFYVYDKDGTANVSKKTSFVNMKNEIQTSFINDIGIENQLNNFESISNDIRSYCISNEFCVEKIDTLELSVRSNELSIKDLSQCINVNMYGKINWLSSELDSLKKLYLENNTILNSINRIATDYNAGLVKIGYSQTETDIAVKTDNDGRAYISVEAFEDTKRYNMYSSDLCSKTLLSVSSVDQTSQWPYRIQKQADALSNNPPIDTENIEKLKTNIDGLSLLLELLSSKVFASNKSLSNDIKDARLCVSENLNLVNDLYDKIKDISSAFENNLKTISTTIYSQMLSNYALSTCFMAGIEITDLNEAFRMNVGKWEKNAELSDDSASYNIWMRTE